MANTREQFIKKMIPYAQTDMKKTGILASVTIAQAILESGDGNTQLASKYNNLFGIKGSYKGQTVSLRTREYTNTYIMANFRVYPSWQESINDHSALLCDSLYNLSGVTDYRQACETLQRQEYATDPTYASTLKSLISQHNLTKYDKVGNVTTSVKNTIDYADKIISIALGENGTKESPMGSNNIKYNTWYYGHAVSGPLYPWCAVFVSWCAYEAGISTSIVPKECGVAQFQKFAQANGCYYPKAGYTPKKGDVILFGTGHTGLVVSCDGTTVQTIEGNASDMVTQKSYSIGHAKTTGYFSPKYPVISGSSSGNEQGKSSGQVYGDQHLEYIKDIAKEKKKETKTKTLKIKNTILKQSKFSSCQLTIFHGKYSFVPVTQDGITWSLERRGVPGQLSFSVKPDKKLKMSEGDAVQFRWNDKKVFYGFIFEIKETEDGIVSVICYDQLRYLKNKDTYIYKQKRADEVIKMIAEDFGLKVGKLAKPKHVIPTKVEDDVPLFDIIENALDDTLVAETKMYVLYDNFGKLTLKRVSDMKVDILIDAQTGQSYSYTTSINDNTYNKIKIAHSNDKEQRRDIYIAKDSKNIKKWGVLQFYEKADISVGSDEGEDKSEIIKKELSEKADALIRLYDEKTKRLQVSKCFGNVNVRPGSLVVVKLDFYDMSISNYMMVEKVKHNFEDVTHTMDLTLVGGVFVA